MTDVEPITVRRALSTDASRLAALSTLLGYPVAREVIAERLKRLTACPEDVVLIAEMPSGEVFGWLHAAEQELLETGRRCEILGLVVDAEHRKLGAGRRLVSAAEAWARERGLAEMAVRSNVARVESHPFYERLGYVRVKTQHAYRKPVPAP